MALNWTEATARETEISPAQHRLYIKITSEWFEVYLRHQSKMENNTSGQKAAEESLQEKSDEVMRFIDDPEDLKPYMKEEYLEELESYASEGQSSGLFGFG